MSSDVSSENRGPGAAGRFLGGLGRFTISSLTELFRTAGGMSLLLGGTAGQTLKGALPGHKLGGEALLFQMVRVGV